MLPYSNCFFPPVKGFFSSILPSLASLPIAVRREVCLHWNHLFLKWHSLKYCCELLSYAHFPGWSIFCILLHLGTEKPTENVLRTCSFPCLFTLSVSWKLPLSPAHWQWSAPSDRRGRWLQSLRIWEALLYNSVRWFSNNVAKNRANLQISRRCLNRQEDKILTSLVI